MTLAYYNEFDKTAANWLRNLIAAGEIAPGHVDDRSIKDVRAADLVGYRQCHFFAGIGGWSRAARIAGWPDHRRLWTGSPPCQPFSVAGKQLGGGDERDLWPDFFRLICDARPDIVVGEQVAAAIRHGWLDRMHDDLEGIAYTGRAIVLPACAVDAPHRRDRLWFIAARNGDVGDTFGPRLEGHAGHGDGAAGWAHAGRPVAEAGGGCDVAHRDGIACGQGRTIGSRGAAGGDAQSRPGLGGIGGSGDVADSDQVRRTSVPVTGLHDGQHHAESRRPSFWSDAEWIVCHDGKARRVKPGLPLLVDGLPGGMVAHLSNTGEAFAYHRATALKGFGNAIVPEVAAELLRAWMECAA